jgi:hypothetical protein
LSDIAVLRDQLIGVDTYYFLEVIRKLKKATKDSKRVDRAYLFEVLDEVFG